MATETTFELAAERLNMRDIFERYGHCLPVIIQVTQGHYSCDIDMDTYSTGHTMRVHSIAKHRRVVARDTHGKHFSFPLDYPIKFTVSKYPQKKDGKEQSLKEIVEENSLPVRIELCLPTSGYSLTIGTSITQVDTFGTLHLTATYEETYLLANSISKDTLDVEILSVPIHLGDLKVATVEGIEGETATAFRMFKRSLDDVAKSISYEGTTGNEDIAVYSQESVSTSTENVYDLIQPTDYIKCRPTQSMVSPSTAHVKELLKSIQSKFSDKKESRPVKRVSGIYSTTITNVEPRGSVSDKPPPIPERRRAVWPTPTQVIHTENKDPAYINSIGRATVAPMEKNVQQPPSVPTPAPPPTATFVKEYTINQIVQCLESLRLGKYAEALENDQISGEILLDLNEDILKSDYGMKSVEALKLMKFARTGYLPH